MIPDSKRAGVERALQAAFGVSEAEETRRMTAGLSSAVVLRVVVRGRPYLLRVITKDDAMNEPTRQFGCMRSAAEAGLAPRVHYTSTEDRISITDFVEARPFARREALAKMPVAIRELHALPRFPGMSVAMNYFEAMEGFIRRFQAAGILPESETAELFRLYGEAGRVYPREEAEMVSSHNDLKPENIVFDGERAWLVDWESAFLNDRYVDLTVVGNFAVTNEAEEEEFLGAYFGEAAGAYRAARFYLMTQMMHVFYAVVFLTFGARGKPVDAGAETPEFRTFHEGILAGEISLAEDAKKVTYGRVHLKRGLENMRGERFREALRVVAGGFREGV